MKDECGNVLKGDVTVKDTTNTYIYASHHMIAAVGVDNLVVIDTPDATFITSQDKAHEVTSVFESFQKKAEIRSILIARYIVRGVGMILLKRVSTSK